jgi:peptide/nickel transport system permease protein
LGILTLTFLVINLLPGDAVAIMLIEAPKEYADELRQALGLDQPLAVKYVRWILPLVTRLDMGRAIVAKEPVRDIVADRLPVTLEVALAATLISAIVAFPLGIMAAQHRGRVGDYLAMQFSQFGQAVPAFWIGTLLFLAVAVRLRWLPSSGWVPLTEDVPGNLAHVFLPALSLALPQAAILTRTIRSAVIEVLARDYIRTAYAKGLNRGMVLWRHAVRNALIPVITIGGVQMGYLLGGSVIIEDLFQLPGIGKLMVQSLMWRDIPVIQGCLVFYASFFVGINLLVDILYSVADPRISIR